MPEVPREKYSGRVEGRILIVCESADGRDGISGVWIAADRLRCRDGSVGIRWPVFGGNLLPDGFSGQLGGVSRIGQAVFNLAFRPSVPDSFDASL